jgi:hypothetical protein
VVSGDVVWTLWCVIVAGRFMSLLTLWRYFVWHISFRVASAGKCRGDVCVCFVLAGLHVVSVRCSKCLSVMVYDVRHDVSCICARPFHISSGRKEVSLMICM